MFFTISMKKGMNNADNFYQNWVIFFFFFYNTHDTQEKPKNGYIF